MQGLTASELNQEESEKKPDIPAPTIDRIVTTVSRISGYVFMAAALGIIVSFFIF